jgi:hypothetical protein
MEYASNSNIFKFEHVFKNNVGYESEDEVLLMSQTGDKKNLMHSTSQPQIFSHASVTMY